MRVFLNRLIRVWLCIEIIGIALTSGAWAQAVTTTTVQGTVYLANGSPGSGTLQVSWPAFTTASDQAIAAGKLAVNIGADGFVTVNLAPNLGSTPAGLFYTAVYHMSDGTTSTEFRWLKSAELLRVLGGPDLQPAACFVKSSRRSNTDANDE